LENEQGKIIGSEIIAQSFTRPEYFWPRPSAVDFNASGAGGSNLSPTNPELRKRAKKILSAYPQAKSGNPMPVDLVTASGSGLDPHITLRAAKYQVERVAEARGMSPQVLERLLDNLSFKVLNLSDMEPLVNVLQVNLKLDKMTKGKRSPLREKRSNRQNEQ
jgi:K+-transporting ATPase ATPase C chain